MTDTDGSTTARVLPRIADIPAAAWDACANPDAGTFNPFVAHAFLDALERSGSVGGRSGWVPAHIVIDDAGGALAAAMPLYVKSHSQGEYVFDHSWAEAYERAGGAYYPKLQCAVPFSPVPGPRLLVRPGPQAERQRGQLAAAAIALAHRVTASSVHVTFLDEATWHQLGTAGFLLRTDRQFHWLNRGYATFDDFLAGLASRKRKAIRREREQALAGGLEIERVSGAAIRDEHWQAMFAFYKETGSRKWGRPYLTRRCFAELGSTMAEHCLLVMARRGGRLVAGALNMIGGDCLYGRYWGAIEEHPCLHFEVCYYQAIDYAIAHKLARVEAGAQGEHKLARGYLPMPTYSAHWIANPSLRRAVGRYLEHERAAVDEHGALLTHAGPYRRDGAARDEQD